MSIRLNNHHRNLLKKHAKEIVMADTEGLKEVVDLKYKLGALAVEHAEKSWPAEDMKILKKYELTHQADRVQYFRLGTSDIFSVDLCDLKGKRVVVTAPDNYRYGRPVTPTQEIVNLYDKHALARDKFNKALNEKLNKYFQVIDHFKTYEKLVEAWPEAAQISNEFTDNLPAAISDDTIAMVKAEAEKRMSSKK